MMKFISKIRPRFASTRPISEPSECYVWGKGAQGTLGLGDTKDSLLPEILEFDNKDEAVKSFSAGAYHSCAIDATNRLWTFGKAEYGRLGLLTPSSGVVPAPTKVDIGLEEGDQIESVDCGHYHTAAVTKYGRVFTWGWGGQGFLGFKLSSGGLGHGDINTVNTPKQVEALSHERVVQVKCGKYHTLALTSEGKVYSWGRGEYGRLGINSTGDALTPSLLETLENIVLLSTSNATSAALDRSGRVFMWGKNDTGQLGIGGSGNLDMFSLESVPVFVEALKDQKIVDISCSDRHTLACTDEGLVFVWGDRQWMVPYLLTTTELGNSPVIQVAAGHNFSVILTAAGNLFSWGNGRSLCLGHGDKDSLRDPTLIEAFDNRRVLSVAAGSNHVGALVEPNRESS